MNQGTNVGGCKKQSGAAVAAGVDRQKREQARGGGLAAQLLSGAQPGPGVCRLRQRARGEADEGETTPTRMGSEGNTIGQEQKDQLPKGRRHWVARMRAQAAAAAQRQGEQRLDSCGQ